MKTINPLRIRKIHQFLSQYDQTDPQDYDKGYDSFMNDEVEDYDEGRDTLTAILHVNHKKKFITKIKGISQNTAEISCSCNRIGRNKMCLHLVALWLEYLYRNDDDFVREELNMIAGNDSVIDDLVDALSGKSDDLDDVDLASIFDLISLLSNEEGTSSTPDLLRNFPQRRVGMSSTQESYNYDRQSTYRRNYIGQKIVKYQPKWTFIPRNLTLKSNDKTKFDQYFDGLDNVTKFGLYFLLSNNTYPEAYFKQLFTAFASKWSDNPDQIFNRLIDIPFVTRKNEEIWLEDEKFKIFLNHQYDKFIRELNDFSSFTLDRPISSKIDIIALLNLILNVFNSSKTVFTTKFEIYKSVFKKIMEELPSLISLKFEEDQYQFLIKFIVQLSIICGFIEISSDRDVTLTQSYFKFLQLSDIEQRSVIKKKYLMFISDPESAIYLKPDSFHLVTTYHFDDCITYLNSYLALYNSNLLTYKSPIFLHKMAIEFDFFRLKFERGQINFGVDYHHVSDFQLLDIYSSDYRPNLKHLDLPFSDAESSIRNMLELILGILGMVIPILDETNNISGYYFQSEIPSTELKVEREPESDIYILPDFTIKGSRTSFTGNQLNWLTKFSRLEKIDNLIETRIEKHEFWSYLEESINHSSTTFLQYISDLTLNEVPDTIIQEIKEWEAKFGYIQQVQGTTFVIPEPDMIEHMRTLKMFNDISIVRLSPTIIVVPTPDATKIEKYLKGKDFHISTSKL